MNETKQTVSHIFQREKMKPANKEKSDISSITCMPMSVISYATMSRCMQYRRTTKQQKKLLPSENFHRYISDSILFSLIFLLLFICSQLILYLYYTAALLVFSSLLLPLFRLISQRKRNISKEIEAKLSRSMRRLKRLTID